MFGRRFARSGSALLFTSSFLCITVLGLSQDVSKEKASSAKQVRPAGKEPTHADLDNPVKRKVLIDKMIADYDLTPHPLPAIPDNPPPHEGALINVPYIVEPPDLIAVEILEALPGRPVSGERLVRPDGTIALGFYGDLQVRGLTAAQIKVAIIKHMRAFLRDEDLGLVELVESDAESIVTERPQVPPLPAERPQVPPLPAGGRKPFEPPPDQDPNGKPPPDAATKPRTDAVEYSTVEPRNSRDLGEDAAGTWKIVPPQASTRVYVEVTAYNNMTYYVLGDVSVPGRLPWTGKETVLDALTHASGLMPTADPKQITLVRPERSGKQAKVYKVDLEAIQKRGEVATNYQIFPGDRLFVERDEVVKKTVELDRLSAPIQTIIGSMQQEAAMLRAAQTASPDHADELYKELVDFWLKQLARRGDLKIDERTMRDALLRRLKSTPSATKEAAK